MLSKTRCYNYADVNDRKDKVFAMENTQREDLLQLKVDKYSFALFW